MVLLISDLRTCHTTWGQTPCSLTTGSPSTTLGRSSFTRWPRQTGEKRPLICYLWWMMASHWSGGWSGDKTSFSGWRTTLRITQSLTWCDMRTRGSSWREQDPLCLTIKVIKLYCCPKVSHLSCSHILWFPGKVAYACESVRTHPEVFNDLCKQIGFDPVLLQANDKQGTDKIKNEAAVISYIFPKVAPFTTPTCSCPSWPAWPSSAWRLSRGTRRGRTSRWARSVWVEGIINVTPDSDEDDQERAEDCDYQPGPGGQPGGQLLRGDRGGREEQDHHLNQVSYTWGTIHSCNL